MTFYSQVTHLSIFREEQHPQMKKIMKSLDRFAAEFSSLLVKKFIRAQADDILKKLQFSISSEEIFHFGFANFITPFF